jgi:DNA-binding PadR family transcriptional regulator
VFVGELGLFWNTSHQAVYRALASMHKDGIVSFVATEQSGEPDKKTYQITSQGEQLLQQWLSVTQPPMQINEDIRVKFFAGNLMESDALHSQVQAHYLVHKKTTRLPSHREAYTGYRTIKWRTKSAVYDTTPRHLNGAIEAGLVCRSNSWVESVQLD